jgi:hypothetical protein
MESKSSAPLCRGPLTQEDAQQIANQDISAEHSGITPLLGKAQHELNAYFRFMRFIFSVSRMSSYLPGIPGTLCMQTWDDLHLEEICAACDAGGRFTDAADREDEKRMPVALTVPSPSGSGLGDIDAGLCCQASATEASFLLPSDPSCTGTKLFQLWIYSQKQQDRQGRWL